MTASGASSAGYGGEQPAGGYGYGPVAPDGGRQGGFDLDPRYWLSVLRRRFWVFLAVWVVVTALGVGYAFMLPPVYEARASILVESQQIPTELVRSTVTAPVSERIAVIRQRLLTRETLLDLAASQAIFPPGADISPTAKVRALREGIRIDQIQLGPGARFGRSDVTATAFTVSFRAGSAETAASVVNDLVTRILEKNASLRRERAETTSNFFSQEVERLSRELTEIERRMAEFMAENEEALPDSLDYRRGQADLLQERAQSLELRRLELEQERGSLSYILDSVERPDRSELERALEAARQALVERSAVLSPQHPEIRGLRSRVAAYEAAVAAEQAAKKQAAEDPNLTPPPSPAAIEARRRMGFIETQIAYIDNRLVEIEAQRRKLQDSILATPNVEIALNALQRAYDETELRLRTARAKFADARAGEQLEDKQQGERFEVLEHATVPEYPIKPSRTKIALAGFGGGMMAGLGLIVFLEMISGVLRRGGDLGRIGRQPMAVLPYITTREERRRVWAARIAAATLVFGGGAAALWAIHVHYLPLETVAQRLLEKSRLDGVIDMVRRHLG